jgi:hypothetical protein
MQQVATSRNECPLALNNTQASLDLFFRQYYYRLFNVYVEQGRPLMYITFHSLGGSCNNSGCFMSLSDGDPVKLSGSRAGAEQKGGIGSVLRPCTFWSCMRQMHPTFIMSRYARRVLLCRLILPNVQVLLGRESSHAVF